MLRRVLVRLGGLGVAQVMDAWMGTMEYRAVYQDPRVDPALPNHLKAAVYLVWHEYIPVPFHMRPHCGFSMLISQHRDAELLSQAASYRGFGAFRGSTNRGGLRAVRTMLDQGGDLRLAITPDGPRGPRRQLALGAIFLAAKLQVPIVLIGLGYDRPWRMNTWDKFAIPKPCSRIRAIFSEPFSIPENASKSDLEESRRWLEVSLNQLSDEAESWAEDRIERTGSVPLYRAAESKR